MIDWFKNHIENTESGNLVKVCIGKPTPEFWKHWRINKVNLKAQGYDVFKIKNEFHVKKVKAVLNTFNEKHIREYTQITHPLLLDYQHSHFSNLIGAFKNGSGIIDASDTGTGKTPVTCAVLDTLKTKFAVICPLSVIPTWKKWCSHFNINPIFIANYESFKGKGNKYGCMDIKYFPTKILKILGIQLNIHTYKRSFSECIKYLEPKYPKIRIMIKYWEKEHNINFPKNKCRYVKDFHWNLPLDTLLVFDEAHYCKGDYTQNSKMLIAAKQFKLILLSATIAESPKDMRAIGYVLGLHQLYDFKSWLVSNDCLQDSFNGWVCDDPINAMLNLSKQIFPVHGSRMRIADINDFPENQLTIEPYKSRVSDKYNIEYKKLLQRISELEKEGLDNNTKFNVMVQIGKFRQMAELIKAPLYIKLSKEALLNGLSVIVVVNYTETREFIQNAFKTVCAVYGTNSKGIAQKPEDRERIINSFQTNKSRLIILMAQAGGVGISLHDVIGGHQRMMFVSPSYNSRQFKQVLGRPHRAGAKSITFQRLVYLDDTIETKVCESVNKKLDNISAINDGDLMERDLLKFKGVQK